MSKALFQGILQGIAEAHGKKQTSLFEMENKRRETLANYIKEEASNPARLPESQDELKTLYLEGITAPKLGKDFESRVMQALVKVKPRTPDTQQTQAPPGAPVPGAFPNMPIAPPIPPEGFTRSAMYSPEEQMTMRGQNIESEAYHRATGTARGTPPEAPTPPSDFTLGPGQQRFDPKGNPIASVAPNVDSTNLPNQQFRDVERGGRVFRQYFQGTDPSKVTYEQDIGPVRAPASSTQEAGSFTPVTDRRGNVTAWVNPKSGRVVKPEDFGLEGDNFRGAMSMDRQTREGAAVSGLKAITKFREELKNNPNLLKQLAIPGSPGARIARAARAEMIDVLTRVRTGAALNDSEQTFYYDQAPRLLDELFDDPAAVAYKLSIFEDNFKQLAPPEAKPKAEAGSGNGSGLIVPGGALDKLLKANQSTAPKP